MRFTIATVLIALSASSACKPPTVTEVCQRQAEVACQRLSDCQRELGSFERRMCVDAGIQQRRCEQYELLDCSVEVSAVDYMRCLDAEENRACFDSSRPPECAQLREALPDARTCPLKEPVRCRAEEPRTDGVSCLARLLDCSDGVIRAVSCSQGTCVCNVGSGAASLEVRFAFDGCPTKETYSQRCSASVIVE